MKYIFFGLLMAVILKIRHISYHGVAIVAKEKLGMYYI